MTNFVSLFSLGIRHYYYVAEVKVKLAFSGQVRAVAEDRVMIQEFSKICVKI